MTLRKWRQALEEVKEAAEVKFQECGTFSSVFVVSLSHSSIWSVWYYFDKIFEARAMHGLVAASNRVKPPDGFSARQPVKFIPVILVNVFMLLWLFVGSLNALSEGKLSQNLFFFAFFLVSASGVDCGRLILFK